MMARSLDDPASWWFFAAIHGEYLTPATTKKIPPDTFPRWSEIQSQPSVPTTPLPNRATQERYWNQCQHGTWYFQMSAKRDAGGTRSAYVQLEKDVLAFRNARRDEVMGHQAVQIMLSIAHARIDQMNGDAQSGVRVLERSAR